MANPPGVITLGIGSGGTIEQFVLVGLSAVPVPAPAVVRRPPAIAPFIPFFPIGVRHRIRVHFEHQVTIELTPSVQQGAEVLLQHHPRLGVQAGVHKRAQMEHQAVSRHVAGAQLVISPMNEMQALAILGLGDLVEYVAMPRHIPQEVLAPQPVSASITFVGAQTDFPLENRCPQCKGLIERNKAVAMRWCRKCKMEVEC